MMCILSVPLRGNLLFEYIYIYIYIYIYAVSYTALNPCVYGHLLLAMICIFLCLCAISYDVHSLYVLLAIMSILPVHVLLAMMPILPVSMCC
jgi:hypothetical protein